MAKFKVGDKVEATEQAFANLSIHSGTKGEIVRVDENDNELPYHVLFEDDACPTWCRESEVYVAVDETVVASGVVSIDYTVASAVVLVGDTHVASKLREYARNGEEIEVVVRVKRKETK